MESLKITVGGLKDGSITKDKINLLKIKVGEVEDQLKKTWALEEEFNVEIPDADAEKMATVGDAIKYINEKSAA